MSIALQEENEGRLLVCEVTGRLSREDYEKFLPEVERLIKAHGKISILFDMHDFHGWSAGAAWEDTKFAFHHFSDIERLAVVGENRWQKAMALFCKPFTRAQVRYFEHDAREQALGWLGHEPAAT